MAVGGRVSAAGVGLRGVGGDIVVMGGEERWCAHTKGTEGESEHPRCTFYSKSLVEVM